MFEFILVIAVMLLRVDISWFFCSHPSALQPTSFTPLSLTHTHTHTHTHSESLHLKSMLSVMCSNHTTRVGSSSAETPGREHEMHCSSSPHRSPNKTSVQNFKRKKRKKALPLYRDRIPHLQIGLPCLNTPPASPSRTQTEMWHSSLAHQRLLVLGRSFIQVWAGVQPKPIRVSPDFAP